MHPSPNFLLCRFHQDYQPRAKHPQYFVQSSSRMSRNRKFSPQVPKHASKLAKKREAEVDFAPRSGGLFKLTRNVPAEFKFQYLPSLPSPESLNFLCLHRNRTPCAFILIEFRTALPKYVTKTQLLIRCNVFVVIVDIKGDAVCLRKV